MEAYFFQDPGIQEHIDHIIEKLFAVCLLTGPDSDAEFQRGLKSAQKLVTALASVSSLSEAEIYNGVRQIIEQRLPDPRVIENFPVFNTVLERMIMESVSIAPLPPTIAGTRVNIIDGRSTAKPDPSQVKIRAYENRYPESLQAMTQPTLENPQAERPSVTAAVPETIPSPLAAVPTEESEDKLKAGSNTKAVIEPVIKSVIEPGVNPKIEWMIEPEAQPETEPQTVDVQLKEEHHPELKPELAPVKMHSSASKPSQVAVKQSLSAPTEAEYLALVLSYLFPKASVRWNMNLAGYQFLAQVEDVLIYLDQLANGTEVEHKMRAEGWRIIVLAYEDLRYWRRLERQIRKTVARKNSKVKTL